MSIPAQNQQYENFIIRYKQNIEGVPEYQPDERFQIINDLFGVLYVPIQEIPELALNSYSYSSIPRCYTYMDTGSLYGGVDGAHLDSAYSNAKRVWTAKVKIGNYTGWITQAAYEIVPITQTQEEQNYWNEKLGSQG